MRKLLVTGLGMAKSLGQCFACNFDYSWLINYPSSLLWADKVLIPEPIWGSVMNLAYPQPQKLASSYKLIFEIAEANDLFEIVKPEEVLPKGFSDAVYHQMAIDLATMQLTFPDKVSIFKTDPTSNDHNDILIHGVKYCFPILWTYYTSLVLSRIWKAQCLLGQDAFHYFRYKFGGMSTADGLRHNYSESFRNVFNMFLPNEPLLQGYVMTEVEKCSSCTKEQVCSDKYLADIEKSMKQYLDWRTYEEIYQIRDLTDRIIKENENVEGFVDPKDVVQDFQNIQKKLKRRLHYNFPKVKRWSNLSTMVSIPLAVLGTAIQNPLIGYSNIAAALISQMSKELVEYFENKYKWVNFSPASTS